MPHCFSLTKKGEQEPASLTSVDDEMCKHFSVEPGKEWYRNWYNIVGLGLAMGHSLDKLKDFMPDHGDIIDWLKENYIPNAWREWK